MNRLVTNQFVMNKFVFGLWIVERQGYIEDDTRRNFFTHKKGSVRVLKESDDAQNLFKNHSQRADP